VSVRAAMPSDAEDVAALIRAYDEAHGVPPDTSADDLRRQWEEVELERDSWLFELDGRLAGYACVYGRGAEHLTIDGYVRPDFTGRGLGRQILRLGEERARERGATRVDDATLHADVRGRALLEDDGYVFVRAFLRMEIELDEPPAEPPVPDGLRLVALTEADDPAVHAALEEAFADHWQHTPISYEAWLRRNEGSDRSLWFAVKDGDELAGVSLNERERHGSGWIDSLGTRRAWRGRGVAHALLLASFAEFRRRGERVVRLAVDASNPTGAVRVYERVGMRAAWRADVFAKDL
jgi:mycothiol synthase